jgi:excisionase family DNA binding protein
MRTLQTISDPQNQGFATIRECASYLRICPRTVKKLIAGGGIPAKRFGNCTRISWHWLKSQAKADGKASDAGKGRTV